MQKFKPIFGSEVNVEQALANGKIDSYDVLFLDEGKIFWVDENGNLIKLRTLPTDEEAMVGLIEADMLPAVHDANEKILTDSMGRVVLRY